MDNIQGDFKSYIDMQIGMMIEDKEATKKMVRGLFQNCRVSILKRRINNNGTTRSRNGDFTEYGKYPIRTE